MLIERIDIKISAQTPDKTFHLSSRIVHSHVQSIGVSMKKTYNVICEKKLFPISYLFSISSFTEKNIKSL